MLNAIVSNPFWLAISSIALSRATPAFTKASTSSCILEIDVALLPIKVVKVLVSIPLWIAIASIASSRAIPAFIKTSIAVFAAAIAAPFSARDLYTPVASAPSLAGFPNAAAMSALDCPNAPNSANIPVAATPSLAGVPIIAVISATPLLTAKVTILVTAVFKSTPASS